MCTVTVIPKPPDASGAAHMLGFRLVCNRDESRDRADATQPRWRDLEADRDGGKRRAIWPADGEAGGTWIAADHQGLTLCLLNRNPTPAPSLPHPNQLISRGKIIPRLISAGTGAEVAARAAGLDLEAFAPFRLIAVDPLARGAFIHEMVWDRVRFATSTYGVGAYCFASSGLGDERVLGRLDLFRSMVVGAGATPEAQDLFHVHRWADRREISVMMSREEARTVSMTHVEVDIGGPGTSARATVRMQYRPVLEEASLVEVAGARSMVGGGGTRG